VLCVCALDKLGVGVTEIWRRVTLAIGDVRAAFLAGLLLLLVRVIGILLAVGVLGLNAIGVFLVVG